MNNGQHLQILTKFANMKNPQNKSPMKIKAHKVGVCAALSIEEVSKNQ